MNTSIVRVLTVAAVLICLGCSKSMKEGSQAAESFSSPQAAVSELIAAIETADMVSARKIFGAEGEYLLSSGDKVLDQKRRANFLALYRQKHAIFEDGDQATLILGRREWPFPVPLVRAGGAWRFDAEAGREEILNRWIGSNELSTIALLRDYVAAQKLYYSLDPDGDGVKSYASRILSTPGKKDGLYWEDPSEVSPFGPFVAAAEAEGYRTEEGKKKPFHGYLFKVLTAQGEHATGGAVDYLSRSGLMTEGFALLAYPAEWGESGIMTFQVNYDGKVYQKNLGEDSVQIAVRIDEYNPDPSWELVKD